MNESEKVRREFLLERLMLVAEMIRRGWAYHRMDEWFGTGYGTTYSFHERYNFQMPPWELPDDWNFTVEEKEARLASGSSSEDTTAASPGP